MTLTRYSTHAGLIGMAALWGASWPWGRIVAQSMPPLTAACVRFLMASVVLLLWLWQRQGLGSLRQLTPRQWLGLSGAAFAGVLGYATCFLLALQTMPAGKAVIVVALNPVVTLAFAVLLFRERINGIMGIGVVMAVAGATYTLSEGSLAALLPGEAGVGELLVLGCVLCWVLYTLIGRVVLTSLDSLATTTLTAILGAGFLLAASLIFEGPAAWTSLAHAPADAWYSVAALAFGGTTLAYAWYLQGVKVLGAGSAAAYIALVPVFGVLSSNLWLGEPLSASLVVGGLLAIGGMAVMHWGRRALG